MRPVSRLDHAVGLRPLIIVIVDENDPQYRLDFIQRALHAAELDGDARASARLRRELRALQNAEAERLADEFQRRMPDLGDAPARAARALLHRHAKDPA